MTICPNCILRFFRKPLSNVPNQGWTLIEVVAVTIVIGILSSMAFPSFNRMQAKNELRSAMSEVQSAFRQAQRNAIKSGATCPVIVDPVAKTVTSSTAGCIPVAVTDIDQNISFASPTASTTITFSYKGNPDITSDQTIRLTSSISSLEERCLVISSEIGLMRSGYWDSGSSTCTTAL